MTEESAKPPPTCKAPPEICDTHIHNYGGKVRCQGAGYEAIARRIFSDNRTKLYGFGI